MNALRLCLGTLTVLPVPQPASVDHRTAGRAMVLAPLAGTVLAVVSSGVWWLLDRTASSLLAAAVTIGVLAVATRGLHLDGLADVADGLGSGRPADRALDVMRRSDIGPFGVVTLMLVLLLQVGSLASVQGRAAIPVLVVALVASRLVLPLLCLRGVPGARPDGLGHLVAGTVSRSGVLAAGVLATVACLAAVGTLATAGTAFSTYEGVLLAGSGIAGVATGCAFGWHCVRRLGGITGDVLGACVEVAFTTVVLVSALS